ncbi:MAG TPA: TonB-dependent receptor, partial [Pseudoxanthomonas sp.]|nr:TonB-dependent receptor [Pseudoxanthomonas sp.]
LDAYQIDVDDRIILSGNLQGAALVSLVSSLGYPNVTSVRYFTNAVDTRTRGVDLVGSYALPLGSGTLNLTGSFGYNKTEITHIAANPPELESNGLNLQRVSRDEQGRIEEVNPKTKLNLGATWNLENWDFALSTTRYGDYTVRNATSAANDQRYGDEWVLDASASYKLQGWTFTLGADNLLDSYPDKTIFATSNSGQFPYSSYSPFGFNGAYVYGRIGYRW